MAKTVIGGKNEIRENKDDKEGRNRFRRMHQTSANLLRTRQRIKVKDNTCQKREIGPFKTTEKKTQRKECNVEENGKMFGESDLFLIKKDEKLE